MFCPKCGTKLVDNAKFCAKCGTAVESQTKSTTPQTDRQAQWNSQWTAPVQSINPVSRAVDPTAKRKLQWWHILLIVGGAIVLLISLIAIAVGSSNDGGYTGGNGNFGNYGAYDDYESDADDSDISKFKFIEDNYYSCSPKFGGNETMILKFSNVTESSIAIEYYSHDLGNYGRDEYDHEFTSATMIYDEEEGCYEFEFCGFWRLYTYKLEYNRYEINQYYGQKFEKVDPVKPEDFWWYEEAKRQTGDYGSGSAADISQAKIGDVISIGKYEMDNNTSNGLDDISWLVIDENDSGILVISKYCIAKQETSSSYETWETSVAREWLNNEFYSNAFTTEEKNKIITSTIVNDDNADTGMDGGNDTSDKLFLLSIDEANKYFTSKEDRKAYGTLYLQELVDEDEDSFGWWLRTPGKRFVTLSSEQIYQSYVGSNGYVYTEGCTAAVYNNGLRPAMWISK